MKRSISKHLFLIALSVIIFKSIIFNASGQALLHTCGASAIHNSAITYGQVSDIDSNSYKTVIIDNKVWFAENLKVTRFQNGDTIRTVKDSTIWASLTGPGMCSYKNDTSFDCPYGKLYNYYVASDSRNPCPYGWRVPSMTDLYDLIFFLDPNADPQQPGNTPNTAGGPLKSSGLTYWRSPNSSATNLTGFSAIPNGGRNDQGRFSLSNDAAASYWLSTAAGPGFSMGFFLELAYPQGYAVRNAYFSKYGCCIRCVTDLNTTGINENQKPKVDVFPNPAEETIHLNLQSFNLGTEYILSDLTGRILLKGLIVSEQMDISIVDIPSGMYFLSIPSTNLGLIKIIKL